MRIIEKCEFHQKSIANPKCSLRYSKVQDFFKLRILGKKTQKLLKKCSFALSIAKKEPPNNEPPSYTLMGVDGGIFYLEAELCRYIPTAQCAMPLMSMSITCNTGRSFCLDIARGIHTKE